MEIKDFFSFGRIVKINKKDNKIIFKLFDGINFSIEDIRFIFVEIDGALVPFEATDFIIGNNSLGSAYLNDIDSIELLKKILACKLFLPKENRLQAEISELASQEFIGYTVIDKNEGELGTIDDILKYPNNPLYKIIYQGKEILIPANENIVLSVDNKLKKLEICIPIGLLNINL